MCLLQRACCFLRLAPSVSILLSVVESGDVCLLSEESLCEVVARCASLAGWDREITYFLVSWLKLWRGRAPCCCGGGGRGGGDCNILFTCYYTAEAGKRNGSHWPQKKSGQLFWPWVSTVFLLRFAETGQHRSSKSRPITASLKVWETVTNNSQLFQFSIRTETTVINYTVTISWVHEDLCLLK